MGDVTVTVTMPEAEAMALGQFVKRVGFIEFESNAVDEAEAYRISDAVAKLQRALAEEGYAPR